MMRMVFAALMMALVLALGVLEVLASRTPAGYDRPDHPDAFAIWHAR
jgi:hypothetical protein